MSDSDHQETNGADAGEADAHAQEATTATAQQASLAGAAAFPYSATGVAFTSWFNGRIKRLPNAVIRLGARTATVKELHADGRLECSLHASAGEAEEAFVAFEPAHLDQLLLKFAAQGV